LDLENIINLIYLHPWSTTSRNTSHPYNHVNFKIWHQKLVHIFVHHDNLQQLIFLSSWTLCNVQSLFFLLHVQYGSHIIKVDCTSCMMQSH
jgi:hypothetical protein